MLKLKSEDMQTAAVQLIPAQTEGEHNDVESTVTCASIEEAHSVYKLVKERLKNISNWHQFVGQLGSTFGVTDAQGNEIYKIAEEGDLFYIDMPGPGSIAGSGYDWVRIEKLTEHTEDELEYIVITVRPVDNPKKHDAGTAHFFSHKSTNTFITERYGNKVSTGVFGRNEMPNIEGNIVDKVRNIAVGLAARHGLSAPHWQVFAESILKT